ncbi:MAG: hypothetical protein SFV54_19720 [Bryobacteraceae bacterium]|nr:hypothetical protein [Bryobacteraceae bacterium]
MRIVYALNILVAGWVGLSALLAPRYAAVYVFSGAAEPSHTMTLVGALWMAIAVCSAFGLARPTEFAPVLVIQLIYKSLWLAYVLVARPPEQPAAMTAFFAAWVALLPFVIPWRHLFT